MSSLKRYFESIFNTEISLEERMYRFLSVIGLVALFFLLIFAAIFDRNIAECVGYLLVMLLFFAITYVSLNYGSISMGSGFLILISAVGVLPMSFIYGGGMAGRAPVWIVFCLFYIAEMKKGAGRFFYISLIMVVIVLLYYIEYNHPDILFRQEGVISAVSPMISVGLVATIVILLVSIKNKVHYTENELIRSQNKQIEEMNRSQNRFFSSMSHEIRTPINTIIGLNEMIMRDENISDEIAQDAANIQGAGKMLLSIINDILDMSKIESGKMDIVPVDYNTGEMFSDIVSMIGSRAKDKGLKLLVDVDSKIPRVLHADEVRIKQVLINLLNNAVKYTQDGSVFLSVECSPASRNDYVKVVYTIRDTGMGIRKESIPHLFDAFQRVDEEKNRHIEGTGLGLSIVKQIVELMEGEISVNSVYTKGSTFIFSLEQRVADKTELGQINFDVRYTGGERRHYRASFEAPSARVLIVDDNEVNLLVEEKLIRDTKVETDTAVSGEEALKMTLKSEYDVIFMDHLMPEMDGIECLGKIREQVGGLNHDTPVVILTANAGSENQDLYRKSGFDEYLLKPVSGASLESTLVKFISKDKITVSKWDENTEMSNVISHKHRNKKRVIITTDSVCDFPADILEKRGIAVLPYRVKTDKGVFLDNVECDADEVMGYMSRTDGHIQSLEPTVEQYQNFFAGNLMHTQSIIHVTMSKEASKGYENALEAARVFDNVKIVDSGHLSSGLGLMVIALQDLADTDADVNEIIEEANVLRDKIRTTFIVNKTKYLAGSKRISNASNGICEALMLHPVIKMKNGKMKVGNIIAGRSSLSIERYIDTVIKSRRIDKSIAFLTHSGVSNDVLNQIQERIEKKIHFDRLILQKASSAISVNCGPGSLGLIVKVIN